MAVTGSRDGTLSDEVGRYRLGGSLMGRVAVATLLHHSAAVCVDVCVDVCVCVCQCVCLHS